MPERPGGASRFCLRVWMLSKRFANPEPNEKKVPSSISRWVACNCMFPKSNAESWQQIHEFIDEFPENDYWSQWKSMVLVILSKLEARGMTSLFRIGLSMNHVLFSTLDHHRLTSEARVTLEFHPKDQSVRVAYSNWNVSFREPISEETIPISGALPRIREYLQRLWSETKPMTPIPHGLNVA